MKYNSLVKVKGGDVSVQTNNYSYFIFRIIYVYLVGDMRHWSIQSSIFPRKNCSCLYHRITDNFVTEEIAKRLR